MYRKISTLFGYLLVAIALAACASGPSMLVPDTQPGDQIENEYLVGEWCTNREETATSNQEAGFSGILNVRPVFWRFGSEGQWDSSTSGFLYEPYGSWQLDGLDKLLLGKNNMEPKPYTARFKNNGEGADLYLTDEKGQFIVLARCD
jgi:hypothetical protein